MLNLIKNEWMKLWSKKGTWTMIILIAAIIISFTGLAKLTETLFDDEEWTTSLETQLEEIDEQLANPDLTEREIVELEMEQENLQGSLEVSVASNQPQTRENIIIETFGIMAIVTLVTIIVASGIVSTEFSQGTIKMLLSRPVNRWKILLSKYLTVLLFALLATVVTYVSSVIGAYVFFPSETGSTFTFYEEELATSAVWGKSLYLMLLSFINVSIIATLAFMLGTVFRSTAMAIGVSMFLYFTGNLIVAFLAKYSFAKYVLFAHTNLTDHITGYLMLSDITMPFSMGVILVYGIIFLALSFLSFTKRDVTA